MKASPGYNATFSRLAAGVSSLLVAGTAAFGQTFYSQIVSNDSPLAYWNFDESFGNAVQQMPVPTSPTTVNDLSPAGTATRVSHSAIGSGLLLGNAASLDGTCNFSATNPDLSALQSLPGPYAIEMWLQLLAPPPVPPWGQDLEVPLSFDNSGAHAVYYDNYYACLELYAGNGRTGNSSIVIPTDDFTWHHVLLVFYGSLRQTGLVDGYLDGTLWPNQTGYNSPLPLTDTILVGNYSQGSQTYGWIGNEDEVAVYDWSSYTNMSPSLLSAMATAMVNDHIRAATVDAAGVTVGITQQPTNTVGSLGGTATFTVAATVGGGGAPLTYQWQENWTNIPNATSASYTTPALGTADSGTIFRVQVSSGNVFANSQTASLGIGGVTITITQPPTNAQASVGGTATFSVVATSAPPVPLSYQWLENAVNISGATNSSYTTPVLQPQDSGTNLFSVEVSAGAINTNSIPVQLVVPTPPAPNTYYSQVVKSDGPLLYWDFDEAKGNAIQQMPVPASPTTANDLVPYAGAHRAVHATIGSGLALGYCAEFSGKDDFNAILPNAGEAMMEDAYGIEFWIQGVGTTNEPAGQTALCFTDSGSVAIYYNNGGPGALDLFCNDGRTGMSGVVIPTSDSNWHHVMYVYYGVLRADNLVDGYLDGVRIADIPCNFDQEIPLTGPITVGDYKPGGGLGFLGRMDELALYDFFSFNDDATLTSYVEAMVARHIAASNPPILSATRAGSQLTLSWTVAGMYLQETAGLSSPVAWTDVPGGANSPITVTLAPGAQFFRLTNAP